MSARRGDSLSEAIMIVGLVTLAVVCVISLINAPERPRIESHPALVKVDAGLWMEMGPPDGGVP